LSFARQKFASGACAKLFSYCLRTFAIHFLCYLPLVLLLQYQSGIYQSELSHQPDESAHVVTSLMIHDYVKTGLGTSPLRFAENYYVHYPKVSIGVWPPVFHSTAAFWMMLFGRTHTALVIFVACQCALCATILALFARRFFGVIVAAALGFGMILLPAFQDASSQMMVDIFITLMQFWAMFRMIEFFRSGNMKAAVWFGVVTALAMLTKGNANCLVVCGILMLLLTRQFSMLKRLPIYITGLIVIFLGLPWQFLSLRMFGSGVAMEPFSPGRFWMLLVGYMAILVDKVSLPLFLFALVGLIVVLVRLVFQQHSSAPNLDAAAAASLFIAIILFHCIAPNPGPDDRYMLPALPLLLLFAALGIRWVAETLPVPKVSPQIMAWAITILCVCWFAADRFVLVKKPEMGFDKVAASLLPAKTKNEVVLICSDTWGEGAFITSMALDDLPSTEHIVLRGSKILSENPWDLVKYHPNFANTRELESYLEQTPVDAIVVDLSHELWEQDRSQLIQTIQENRSKWRLASESFALGERRHLQLYRWNGADHSKMNRSIRIKMPFTLGRDLVLK